MKKDEGTSATKSPIHGASAPKGGADQQQEVFPHLSQYQLI